jgi:hypothetical protein
MNIRTWWNPATDGRHQEQQFNFLNQNDWSELLFLFCPLFCIVKAIECKVSENEQVSILSGFLNLVTV